MSFHTAPRHAEMLGALIDQHCPDVWLVNTGWTGGPAGVRSRIKLKHTRTMVQALLAGKLGRATLELEPIFGLAVPSAVDGVPAELLRPRCTWGDPAACDAPARNLAGMFRDNFKRLDALVGESAAGAGPRG